MVGKYVPSDDAQWKGYIQLLRILTISTAIEVTEDTISILSLLVRDYLVTFNSLYPGSITPKLHYQVQHTIISLWCALFGRLVIGFNVQYI